MKLKICDLQKNVGSEIEMPLQFEEAFRPDLIKRSVLAIQSKKRQAYGAFEGAGKRHSSDLSKRRRKYRGSYGFGISRVNRKIHTRRGTRFFWVGAFSPQTRGGRRSHPAKASKEWDQKINKKENRFAIRSAMAASLNSELVSERGHVVPSIYPFVIDSSFENVGQTKEVLAILNKLGFEKELIRSSVKKVRSGKGTMRGRKYKRRKGLLFVVSKKCPLLLAARNIPGVDIEVVNSINCELLAPGTHAGRATLWTQAAVEEVKKNNLFQ